MPINKRRALFMMSLLFLCLLVFFAWPYYTVHRLSQALLTNDQQMLQKFVDVEAIRRQFKHRLEHNIEDATEGYDNPVFRFLRGGVKELGGVAFETVDYPWIRETLLNARTQDDNQLTPVLGVFSFACFERPTRFLIRVGKLGENPVHVYMTLQNWQWRVTALFV